MRARFSIGWMGLAYVMIVGGMFQAGMLVRELELAGAWLGSSVLLVGAAGAAFVAGRLSRRVTVIEPAVASVLVAATVLVVVASLSADRASVGLALDRGVAWWLQVAALCGFGAFVGALAGERSGAGRGGRRSIALAITATLTFTGLLTILLLVIGLAFGGGDQAAAVLTSIVPASLGSGVVTQMAADRRAIWLCGCGGPVFLAVMVAMDITSIDAGTFFGCLILSGLCWLMAGLGARLGWGWFVSRRPAEPDAVPLPPARLR